MLSAEEPKRGLGGFDSAGLATVRKTLLMKAYLRISWEDSLASLELGTAVDSPNVRGPSSRLDQN
jgi:hypothetical protein